MENQKVICIDFDGTLANYDYWRGETHFGTVIHGAKDALVSLKNDGWTIIIFTTRGNTQLIKTFLNKNELIYDYINFNPNQPKNANDGKPYADIYVDDRAVEFKGDWKRTLKEIERFQPWGVKKNDLNTDVFHSDFLHQDFSNCFGLLKHYDSLSWDITKFSFTQLIAGIAAVWFIFGFSIDPDNASSSLTENLNLVIPSIFGLCYLFSVLSTFLISRNRVYFAKVARYINEHRKFSLDMKPHGFTNNSMFYTNYRFPPAFDKWSTQLVSLYVIQLIGSIMFGGIFYSGLFPLIMNKTIALFIGVLLGLGSFIVNLTINIKYMKKYDKKIGL